MEDATSQALGRKVPMGGTAIASVANYAICRKCAKTGIHLSGSVGKILSTLTYTVAYTIYLTDL